MRFFGLKSCDTCRRALKDLAGRDLVVVDVRADGLTDEDRAQIVAAFGDGALNKRSTTWRQLSDTERAQPVDALLAAHPTVMKRPVIEADGRWYQGWNAETKQALGIE